MHDADFTNGNTLPHEVEIDLNVLGALMLDGVGAHVDGADVVTVLASATPLAIALYSASALDRDTVF